MAPECLIDRKYSEKTDVWAYAVTLVEMATRQDPYPDLAAVQVSIQVNKKTKN